MHTTTKRTPWWAAGLLTVGLVGCGADGAAPASEASLFDVTIPEDFTFATTAGLTVRAEGDLETIASTKVEVRLPDGALVHQGTLTAPVEIAVPTAAAHVQVTLLDGTADTTLDVPVEGGVAVVPVR